MTASYKELVLLTQQLHQAHRGAMAAELAARGLGEVGHPILLTLLQDFNEGGEGRCGTQRELAAEYGAEGLGPCPMLKEGQVFFADYARPDGLCDEAWKAIYQYAFALAHGADKGLFYYGDWIRKPGVAICSCNDGLRPVIFRLEATDEESVIDYTPVR